jgi:hypothetical protein
LTFVARCWLWTLPIAFALATSTFPSRGAGAPANTLRELFAGLNRCLAIASGPTNSEITIVFSLRRDGALFGVPRVTFAKLAGDAEAQRKLTASIADAFNKCLPLPITDGLGGAVAGRPLSVRFVIRAPATET